MQQADVVLYDRLVSKGVMELVRRDPELIYVGKKGGSEYTRQIDNEPYGNYESEFNGFGCTAGATKYSSSSKGSLNPIIRVVRSLSEDPYEQGSILDHIGTMNLELGPGKKQKPTIWATHIVTQIQKAISEGALLDEGGIIRTLDIYDDLYDNKYKELSESFLNQYSIYRVLF